MKERILIQTNNNESTIKLTKDNNKNKGRDLRGRGRNNRRGGRNNRRGGRNNRRGGRN